MFPSVSSNELSRANWHFGSTNCRSHRMLRTHPTWNMSFADKLPQNHSPDGAVSVSRALHPALAEAAETVTPIRDTGWYKAYDRQPATTVTKTNGFLRPQ